MYDVRIFVFKNQKKKELGNIIHFNRCGNVSVVASLSGFLAIFGFVLFRRVFLYIFLINRKTFHVDKVDYLI